MKHRLLILILLLYCSADGIDASSLHDYGLYFKSHSVPAEQRTSLFLDNNLPFPIKNEFAVSFQMYVRNNEPDFGSILHLHTNTQQLIRFSLVAGEGSHFPALVFNEGIVPFNIPIVREKWLDVSVRLRLKDNVVEVDYDGKKISAMVPLQGAESVTALFGQMNNYLADVAPVNMKNVIVIQDGEQTREWKLWKHNADICHDEKQGAVARALNPFWLIDNHVEWKQVYREKIPGRLDVAFNAREALFYLVRPQSIEVLDEDGVRQREIIVRGGYPAMEYTNHLLYDTLSNKLVSYNLKKGTVSYFSFDTETWSGKVQDREESYYYNHARTFNPADSCFYFFGGYGFYQYRNELFRLKSGSDRVEKVEYEHPFSPRYSAAAGVAGDEFFIFGGRGNKYGKQELSSHFYFDLCAINIKTRQSRLVWKKNTFKEGTLMASSMYFEPSDSSFYAISMQNGGTLWKVSMTDSVYVKASKPIHNAVNYQDCDFSLYASPSRGKLFLVLDKIMSDHSHDAAIYSINMPLLSEVDIMQPVVEETSASRWYIYVVGALLLIGLGGVLLLYYSKRGGSPEEVQDTVVQDVLEAQETFNKKPAPEVVPASAAVTNYYDRSRASISLLGGFNVRDKKGHDITSNFTPRLKHLLILLIIYTEKNEQGILASKTTGILWPEKDETSARNNRNVNLRKLRVLLESIGDVEVVVENNFLHIKWGEDVFCDYHTLFACIRQFKQEESTELLNRILELLLYGPLLPNTLLDWLDDFKEAYSSYSIDLLKNLLETEGSRNHQDMIIRIADIMFLHDPLNEEALAAKCAVFSAQGKKGIARNVYDRFCKEYKDSMGEDYKVPFAEIYRN
ncbi:hypothetical protein [Bacteroides sp. 51]|uniref:hypothetical protein n=1 Tax=Bacteroides sp. 51 TaxID=2302938 RepID=UPI0013D44B02|nr:hypothetical protein [Bacteroides sp. 51]NDV81734.1 hypothetical protein [Bacteroides sp. 51]